MNFGKPGFRQVVVDNWSLFGGGCEHKFDCISEPVKKWLLFKSGRYSEVLS